MEVKKILINSKIIGERLKEQREKKKMPQSVIAKELGISQPAYCQFEKGRKIPNTSMLMSLAEVLGVSLDYLAGRE
ncbi:MAG: helix-turn-helix transcriptional regulator [Eubacterium sp.]|nr:helix-turn-helix transcriptional regulator [Eubacterium sp.]